MGEGIGGFIVYTVKTETTRASWNGKTFEVTRRFSDFLGLYEKLAGKYQHKGYYILPAPEKSIMTFTKGKTLFLELVKIYYFFQFLTWLSAH